MRGGSWTGCDAARLVNIHITRLRLDGRSSSTFRVPRVPPLGLRQWSVVMRGGGRRRPASRCSGARASRAACGALAGGRAGWPRPGDATAGSFGARRGGAAAFGLHATLWRRRRGGRRRRRCAWPLARRLPRGTLLPLLRRQELVKSFDVASASAAAPLVARFGVGGVGRRGGGVGETVATARATDATAFGEGFRRRRHEPVQQSHGPQVFPVRLEVGREARERDKRSVPIVARDPSPTASAGPHRAIVGHPCRSPSSES